VIDLVNTENCRVPTLALLSRDFLVRSGAATHTLFPLTHARKYEGVTLNWRRTTSAVMRSSAYGLSEWK